MSGIKKDTGRQYQISLIAGQVTPLFFRDTEPTTFQIRNNSVGTLYVSDKNILNNSNYDISVVSGGTRVYTKPQGLKILYLYSQDNISVQINSYETDGIYPVDLDQTQVTVITNSTTTSSVLVTGIQGSLPAGTNNIGKVTMDSLPALPSGSNTIGKVDINSLPVLPSGDNNIGNVDVVTLPAIPTGSNKIGRVDIDLSTTPLLQPSTTPNIYNITCTNANTEYSQALPANTRKIILSFQDGDNSFNYRYSFQTGKVATPTAPYKKYTGDVEYTIEDILLNGATIYFASSVAGKVVQLEVWS